MYGGKLMFGQHDDVQQSQTSSDNGAMSDQASEVTAPQELNQGMPSSMPDHDDGSTDDLLNIKQHALSQLSPLVTHLEQAPEERFHTLMMMIQASDNQSLIKAAYEAASQITDEKKKAQALLDVVNEINYFTHPKAPTVSE